MTLVSTVTVGAGGASQIDFSSVPQTGTDLIVHLSGRNTVDANSNGAIVYLRPNGSSSNGSSRMLVGTGTTSISETDTNIYGRMVPSDYTSNTFSVTTFYIANYAGSTNKSISTDAVNENNATATRTQIIASLWSSTSAITSISLVPAGGTFAQYSVASLYTVTKGSGGATVS